MQNINHVTGYDISIARLEAGFKNRDDAAHWLGVHTRTLARQETGESRPSIPTYRALRLRAGDLGQIDNGWSGWWLYGNRLRYDRQEWRPGDIMCQQYERALIAELKRRLRKIDDKQINYSATVHRLIPTR